MTTPTGGFLEGLTGGFTNALQTGSVIAQRKRAQKQQDEADRLERMRLNVSMALQGLHPGIAPMNPSVNIPAGVTGTGSAPLTVQPERYSQLVPASEDGGIYQDTTQTPDYQKATLAQEHRARVGRALMGGPLAPYSDLIAEEPGTTSALERLTEGPDQPKDLPPAWQKEVGPTGQVTYRDLNHPANVQKGGIERLPGTGPAKLTKPAVGSETAYSIVPTLVQAHEELKQLGTPENIGLLASPGGIAGRASSMIGHLGGVVGNFVLTPQQRQYNAAIDDFALQYVTAVHGKRVSEQVTEGIRNMLRIRAFDDPVTIAGKVRRREAFLAGAVRTGREAMRYHLANGDITPEDAAQFDKYATGEAPPDVTPVQGDQHKTAPANSAGQRTDPSQFFRPQ